MHRFIITTLGQAKRVIVTVVGFTILAIGVAMIVLPGPALLVIPAGLALLATEFIWARKLLASATARLERWKNEKGHTRA
jgi:tellurite resistance protein TerC